MTKELLEEIEKQNDGMIGRDLVAELIAAIRDRDARIASLEAALRRIASRKNRLDGDECSQIARETLDAKPTGGTEG